MKITKSIAMKWYILIFVLFFSTESIAQDTMTAKAVNVSAIFPSYERVMVVGVPDSLRLTSFYKKYSDAFGIPIESSEKVPDEALLVARDIVNYLLMKRMDIKKRFSQLISV